MRYFLRVTIISEAVVTNDLTLGYQALVSQSSNFLHWPLLVLLVALG